MTTPNAEQMRAFETDCRDRFENYPDDDVEAAMIECARTRGMPIDENVRHVIKMVMAGSRATAELAERPQARRNGHRLADDVAPPDLPEPPQLEPDDRAQLEPEHQAEPPPPNPAKLVTPADWPEGMPPPIDWLADHRIPRGDVTTLHGDGGAGKTDIALTLGANVARGARYWLGHEIAAGPVVVISAEEPEREVRRRMALHAERDGYDLADVSPNMRLWFPDDVAGCTLATADRSGVMQATPLFLSIKAAIAEIAPVLVILDNVAATYAGDQNGRVGARTFVNLWRGIAHGPGNPAVLMLDHPSLSGLTAGTGRGGNMDWRNAVRAALYLTAPPEQGEADRGIRILRTEKSNYAKSGKDTEIRLQWVDGGLTLEPAQGSLHRLAKDTECEETFLRLLDERNAQARPVSDKPSSTYAPAVFAEMQGNGGFARAAFSKAMERLFAAGRITMHEAGPPTRRRAHIVRAPIHHMSEAAE